MVDVLIGVVIFGAGLLFRGFLPAYVSEKGKNLATKEDIAQITKTVEAIRTDNALAVQRQAHQDQQLRDLQERTHSMRLVAAEERLATLQQAYRLWRQLVSKAHGPEPALTAIVMECQEWWNSHCLYLDDKARNPFYAAYSSAAGHKDLLSVHHRTPEAIESIKENWQFIVGAGAVIVEAAALPPMSKLEAEIVGVNQGATGAT